MATKILVVTNLIPLPAIEADAQDRLDGVIQLKRLGFDVRMIAKCFEHQDRAIVKNFSEKTGIRIDLIPYEFISVKTPVQRAISLLKRAINPFYWDGAAYEYAQKATKRAVNDIVEEWRPQAVFFDSTFLWPLYSLFRHKNIPIITRSLAFEANQYLKAGGWHYVKLLTKSLSEIMTVWKSDILLVLTPDEEKIYRLIGAKNKMSLLPLRSLANFLAEKRPAKQKEKLNIFFSGSSYSHLHNRRALEFVLQKIAPEIKRIAPNKFIFHVTGKKLPPELNKYFDESVIYHGLVDDFGDFLKDMDATIVPVVLGTGMQQKIFEPLCRGIPIIASPHGLAGYAFRDGEELLIANNEQEFVSGLIRLLDTDLRNKLSKNALVLCKKLFAREVLDRTIIEALEKVGIATK